MREKKIRTTRAVFYVILAAVALILIPIIGDSTVRLAALAAAAVYCLVMAFINFRKARQEEDE